MERPTLYSLIGELRDRYEACKYLNKQRIVDLGVDCFQKLLISKEIIKVAEILLDNYNDSYSLSDNIEHAIYDYLKLSKN